MKLKTKKNGSHDLIDATDENLIHDALAAHALMRAIREWWKSPPGTGGWPTDAVVWIEQRADALMREWTGEVVGCSHAWYTDGLGPTTCSKCGETSPPTDRHTPEGE